MDEAALRRPALSASVAAALLAACGGSQPPIGAPGALPQVSALAARANSTKYKVVYSFHVPPDGNNPMASLVDVDGTLYGTTAAGGSSYCGKSDYDGDCGTVYSLTPSGKEKVLHSFGGPPDGDNPQASMIDMGGTLYGTTAGGGTHYCETLSSVSLACGTVFNVTTDGAETVLHSFGSPHDGAIPSASLINVTGTLFGTTQYGGGHGHGSVFSISTSGTEQVVYAFSGPDGAYPYAGLIDVRGTLYGTTVGGGANSCGGGTCGTVFSVTKSGTEKVLHSFGSGSDGWYAAASLINVRGTLYGTTTFGGTYGWGTVFSISTSGKEKVLHSFGSGSDGQAPSASLLDVKGTLYGTTEDGGGAYGRGTVFSISTSGREKVLHTFGSPHDGSQPFASLIDVKGMLYGTTAYGGKYGNGTVFALSP